MADVIQKHVVHNRSPVDDEKHQRSGVFGPDQGEGRLLTLGTVLWFWAPYQLGLCKLEEGSTERLVGHSTVL